LSPFKLIVLFFHTKEVGKTLVVKSTLNSVPFLNLKMTDDSFLDKAFPEAKNSFTFCHFLSPLNNKKLA
jgi:hypothetical protein